MSHRELTKKLFMMIVGASLLFSATACTTEDEPLPAPTNVAVQPGNSNGQGTVIVSWAASSDPRVEGYAIYRAEQGIGTSDGEKTEHKLQAITVATQYVDDELRTTERFPTTRYFYLVAVICSGGERGTVSEEVSLDYQGSA